MNIDGKNVKLGFREPEIKEFLAVGDNWLLVIEEDGHLYVVAYNACGYFIVKQGTLPDKDELTECNVNNDCALVNSDCCGCSAGGGMTCINKKYVKYWNQKLNCREKVGKMSCPSVYLCGSNPTGCECTNNICREIYSN